MCIKLHKRIPTLVDDPSKDLDCLPLLRMVLIDVSPRIVWNEGIKNQTQKMKYLLSLYLAAVNCIGMMRTYSEEIHMFL